MANTTAQLKNVNLLTKAQYDGVENTATNELYAVETPTVIETYSDDNGNWYRIYSDGWVEQGGSFGAEYTSYTTKTINLLKPYDNNLYSISIQSSNTGDVCFPTISSKTTTQFTCNDTYNYQGYATWQTCGQGE